MTDAQGGSDGVHCVGLVCKVKLWGADCAPTWVCMQLVGVWATGCEDGPAVGYCHAEVKGAALGVGDTSVGCYQDI